MGRRFLFILFLIGIVFFAEAQKITPQGPVSFCAGKSAELKVTDAEQGVVFQWLKDGDTIKNATSTIYTVSIAGSYSVIISKRSQNRKDTTIGPVEVVVHKYPTVDFTSNVQTEQCRNTAVTFTATTTNDKTYSWSFGDPSSGNKNTSTQKNPSHVFVGERGQKNQKFQVTLTVTGDGGCSITVTKEITINIKTDAALNGSGIKTYNGETYFTVCSKGSEAEFLFTNNSSTNDRNINYRIIWGDNTPDFNSPTFNGVINHTYTVGAKTLLFIVTGESGCIDTAMYKVFLGTNPAVGFSNPGNTSICTESTLTFPILDVQNNSPGTKYTVSINDGSNPVTFDHPPPLNYTHKFLNPSCGTTSGNYPNSFSAKIVATNPCLTSEAVVTPIYVSGKPKASMQLSSSSVCVNKLVRIENTSVSASNVTTSGVCSNAKVVWKILSPSGWKLQSGSLGNDNGTLNTDLWVPGSSSLDIIFTATGKYKIVVLSGNINCGVSTDTAEICVNPIPVPNFTLDKNIGCGPFEVIATSSVNPAECGTYKYKWTVDYSPSPGCSPSVSQYEYIGSNDESVNPKFNFINPGVYTIGLVVSTADGGCFSQKITKTVTVKSKPLVEFSPLVNAICEFGSISPKATAKCSIDGNTKFLWTFEGGTPATSSSPDPGKVTYNSAGQFNISLDVQNECGITNKTSIIKVTPVPTLTVPSNQSACNGDKIKLPAFSATPASAISWKSSVNIGAGTSGTNSISEFIAYNPGSNPIIATITVTAKATDGGCEKSEQFTITVYPTPAAPKASDASYCQNATASQLEATALAGHTLVWYSSASGGSPLSSAPTPSTNTVGTQTYYVAQKNNSGGCESPRLRITVTIQSIPTIVNINQQNPSICGGKDGYLELTGLQLETNYLVSYNGISVSLRSDGAGKIKITGLGAGIYNNVFVTLNGCPSNPKGPFTLSDPNPPAKPTATNNSPICSGGTLELKTGAVTGASYNWSGPNGFISHVQNPVISNVTTAANGIYTVTVTVAGCGSEGGTTNVIINETPKAAVKSNSPICSDQDLQLLSETNFKGAMTYSWTGPDNFKSSDPNPKISPATQTATGKYILVITSSTGNCESNPAELNAVVNLTPEIKSTTPKNPTQCLGSDGAIVLKVLTASEDYEVSYIYKGQTITKTIRSDANNNITISGLSSGTYTDIFVKIKGCQSEKVAKVDLTDPNPPAAPSVSSNSPICSGNDLKLTASTISNATYTWSGPGGYNSVEQNPTRTSVSTAATGNYSVTATVAGCTSQPSSIDVIINETPVVSVSSNSPICSDQELKLTSTTLFSGVLTYSWKGPAGFVSSILNPSIPNAQQTASGTYKLIITAATGNCPSIEATTQVVVNLTPKIDDLKKTDPTNCKSSTGAISFKVQTAKAPFTVNYLQNGIAKTVSITSDDNAIITIKDLPAGNYEHIYIISDGNCNSNELGPISLVDPNPPMVPTITGTARICSGNEIQLNAQTSSTGNTTYNWTGPNFFQSNLQNVVIKNATTAMAGTYSVIVNINNCTSAAGTFVVMVDSTPASPKIITNSPICSDNPIKLDFTTDFPGVLTYKWTGPANFESDLKNPTIPAAAVKNSGAYKLVITSSDGCHSESIVNVIVHLTPVITADFTNPHNCGKADGTITIHGVEKNTAHTIGYTKDNEAPVVLNNVMSDASGDIKINNLRQGDYSKIFVILNNCSSNEVSVTLHDPAPPVIQSISNNSPLCFGSTLMLQSKADPGVTYAWAGPNNFFSTEQNPMRASVAVADAGKYILTITRNNCSTTDFTDVIINALPAPPIVADIEYCINTPSVPLTATAGTGSILLWYSSASGGTGSTTAPTPSTAKDGISSFFVSQKDGNGCESPRAEIKVTVHPDAIAEFTPTKIIDCPPFSITTQDIGLKQFPLNNKLYEWYVNGTSIGEGIQFPGYTIKNEDDTVTVTLKTISLFGCKNAEVSHNFATFKLPHPSFEVSTDEGCGPLKVIFSNTTSDKGFFKYEWNFGNGITSKSADPGEITFEPNPNAGDTVYIVRLKTWNDCDTVTIEKIIRVKSRPIAIFTPSKTEGCSPMTVTFANTTKGKNVTYHWDFGDGTTYSSSVLEDVSHTFNTGTPTTFTVRLTATNECGSHFKEFKIVVSPNPIKLKFAMNGPDHFGCEPHTIVIYNNTAGASSFFWDFGDGNFLSTTKGVDSIQHTYLSPGDYKITVKASNNCTDTIAYDYVKVYPKPKAAFKANRYVACIGDEISFTNESQLATSYLWDFGDGITSTLADPKHIYKTSGLFTVKLTVYKLNGPGSTCIETVEQKIQVNDTMPGSFKASMNIGDCAPFTIKFENDIKPSVTAVWDFGDGTSGNGDLIEHTYKTSGVYIVSLTITVPGGCTYTSKQTITIKGPSGKFGYTSGFVCGDNPVRFEATATGTDTYFWNFGDGHTQTTSDPVVYHAYSVPGNYVPSLTLKNNTGCNYPIKGIDTIKADKIEVGFNTTDTKICELTTVHFTDTSHVFFGKKSIEWDFGDGQKDFGAQVSHQYKVSGIYTIMLKITGNSGCVETLYRDISVHVNNNPTVIITANKTGCDNDPVNFTANILSDDAINTIEWKISNGVTGTGKSFKYLFQTPGTYTVTWTVGTVNGCYGTATHTITISPAPTVTANADLILCLGNSVQLNATGGNTYQWTPLEGLNCTTCDNPIATPTKTTPYVVAGYNNFGCVDRDTVYVTVIPPLKLTTSGNDSICIGQSANLLVSGAASYWWTPAEGLSSTSISNPIANPIITTKYRVVGYDGHGCFSDTAYIVVGVGDYPTVDLGPDQTLSTGTIFPLKSTITNGPIKNWLWTPSTNLDCANCPEPKAHIKKEISYAVEVTSIYGCKASDTINIKVFCENTQVFIPNAFTPDGDGVNDILMVRGTGIVTVKSFRIFNRWGALVFEKNNFPPNEPSYGWDGRINGKVGPSEVFVYTAEVICENGTIYTYKGNTSILK